MINTTYVVKDEAGKNWVARLVTVVNGLFPYVFAVSDGADDTVFQCDEDGNCPKDGPKFTFSF